MGNTFARRHPAEGMSLQLCCGTRSWMLLFPRDKAVFLLTGSQIFIWQPFVKRLALFWSPVFLICCSRPWLLTSKAKRRGLISVGDLMVAKGGEIPGVWAREGPSSLAVRNSHFCCRDMSERCRAVRHGLLATALLLHQTVLARALLLRGLRSFRTSCSAASPPVQCP